MYKLREWRRKSRALRLAETDGIAKVEEPYVDELPQSPTVETVADAVADENEVPPPPPKSSPPAE